LRSLLDTHVLLWWFGEPARLSPRIRRVLRAASPEAPLLLADISLWEVATLYERGRIALTLPLREWLERAAAPPLVQRCGLSPAVAAEVAALPDSFSRDPADRILVATARVHGARMLTCDRRIIEAGIVPTVS
jgi:PIN domain nuclease of toxin-antitoxin system